MIRIDQQFLDCVVYLYKNIQSAQENARAGGSGFIVSIKSFADPRRSYGYVVTNRHLTEQGYCTVRMNTIHGNFDIIDVSWQSWYSHPNNDIAVAPVSIRPDFHKFRTAGIEHFITSEKINKLGIGVGDEVFLVGRLMDSAGKIKNTPSARFGAISMMPIEPVTNNFLNRDLECFLCEVRSIGGFSGSPVFVYIPPFTHRPDTNEIGTGMRGPWLLGVDWGHQFTKEPILTAEGKETGNHVKRNTGVACIAPAWNILEILNHPDLLEVRSKGDEEIKQAMLEPTTETDSTRAYPKTLFSLVRITRHYVETHG